LILKTTIVVCEINKLLYSECIFLIPQSRVRGSANKCFTALRARGAVGINLNNAGFLEQGKNNPVLTVNSSVITRTRNTCTVICITQTSSQPTRARKLTTRCKLNLSRCKQVTREWACGTPFHHCWLHAYITQDTKIDWSALRACRNMMVKRSDTAAQHTPHTVYKEEETTVCIRLKRGAVETQLYTLSKWRALKRFQCLLPGKGRTTSSCVAPRCCRVHVRTLQHQNTFCNLRVFIKE